MADYHATWRERPPKERRAYLVLYVCCVVEAVVACIVALLVFEPKGSLLLYSCGVAGVADWYPVLHDPQPPCAPYFSPSCANEVVYPLLTWILASTTGRHLSPPAAVEWGSLYLCWSPHQCFAKPPDPATWCPPPACPPAHRPPARRPARPPPGARRLTPGG